MKGRKPIPLFDDNRHLVDDNTFNTWCDSYQKIINSIQCGKEYTLETTRDREAINDFVRKITEKACENLLDKEGNIKPYNSISHTIKDRNQLVGAFISNIMMNIKSKFHGVAFFNQQQAFDNYLNENRARLVHDILQEKFSKLSTLEIAVGVVSALVAVGSFAYNAYTKVKDPTQPLPASKFKPF